MVRFNLTRLRYFVAVADTLNFRKAAEVLHVAQPAVSRSIQMLETELGFKLLDRTTRRVTLTVAGAVLAEDARQALERLDRSVRYSRELTFGQAGEITLGYSAQAPQELMADLVVRFRQAYPKATVSLYQMASDEQQEAISEGRIELGLMLTAACRAPLSHLLFCRERFVLLVSREHRYADRESISLAELRSERFIAGAPKRWRSYWSLVEAACREAGFTPTVVEKASDVPVILQLVAQGLGLTLYGEAIARTLTSDVVAIPLCDKNATFDMGIVWSEKRISPLAQTFLSFMRTVNQP